LKLLAFNAQKFRGSRDPGHAPFAKFLRGHVWAVPENMHVKFEVRSFNRFGAIIDQSAVHTQTQRTKTISAIHSFHLAEIINRVQFGSDTYGKIGVSTDGRHAGVSGALAGAADHEGAAAR